MMQVPGQGQGGPPKEPIPRDRQYNNTGSPVIGTVHMSAPVITGPLPSALMRQVERDRENITMIPAPGIMGAEKTAAPLMRQVERGRENLTVGVPAPTAGGPSATLMRQVERERG